MTITYDDFTEDIEENRLLRAAIDKLLKLKDLDSIVKIRLRHFDNILSSATLKKYEIQEMPNFNWNRLNEHYKPSIDLAKFIILHSSFDLNVGNLPSLGFLLYMPKIFEDFILVALRRCEALSSLKPNASKLRQGHSLAFDRQGSIIIKPDISFWESGLCKFVGDVKYKILKIRNQSKSSNSVSSASDRLKRKKQNRSEKNMEGTLSDNLTKDLYQIFTYTVSTKLKQGMLIYAEDETKKGHRYPSDSCSLFKFVDIIPKNTETVLKRRAVNINVDPLNILNQIEALGEEIKQCIEEFNENNVQRAPSIIPSSEIQQMFEKARRDTSVYKLITSAK